MAEHDDRTLRLFQYEEVIPAHLATDEHIARLIAQSVQRTMKTFDVVDKGEMLTPEEKNTLLTVLLRCEPQRVRMGNSIVLQIRELELTDQVLTRASGENRWTRF